MTVNPDQPYQLIYSLSLSDHLGPVIEPFAVQLDQSGGFTLSYQRIHQSNISNFNHGLHQIDYQLVELMEGYSHETLARKFSKQGKRPSEFLEHEMTDDLYKRFLRPYIEKRVHQVLSLLINHAPLYLNAKRGNPTWKQLKLVAEPANVIFRFQKNDQGTIYHPKIFCGSEKVLPPKGHAHLLTNDPCWLLVNKKVYHFAHYMEGNKLKPFLNKWQIEIPPKSEPSYYRKFIARMIENYQVEPVGFEIRQHREVGEALLYMSTDLRGEPAFVLYFSYQGETFLCNKKAHCRVKVDESGAGYVFTKINRHREWEKNLIIKLENLGLLKGEGAYFYTKHDKNKAQNYAQNNYAAFHGLITWVNQNKEELNRHRIYIRQDDTTKQFFIGKSQLTFDVDEQTDWFDIYATVHFGSYQFPFIELKHYILNGIREFSLPDRSIAIIPEEWFAQYYQDLLNFGEETKGQNKLSLRKHHFQILDSLVEGKKGMKRHLLESVKNVVQEKDSKKEVQVPKELKCQLRGYQKEGYSWLYFLKQHFFGGILADDMGLGKTLQTLAVLQKDKEEQLSDNKAMNSSMDDGASPDKVFEQKEQSKSKGNTETSSITGQLNLFKNEKNSTSERVEENNMLVNFPPNLIIMPSSLIHNWKNEIKIFAPDLKTLVFQGLKRDNLLGKFDDYDIVLTTYGLVRNDIEALKKWHFRYVILDESQVIKNPGSKTAQAVKQLGADHKLVLTGTPVENSLTDLWSQMAFLNPGLLGGYEFFKKHFVKPIEKQKDREKQEQLKKLINPFLLRRTKEEVAKELPSLSEKTQFCELEGEQQNTYERIKSFYRNQIFENIEKFGIKKSQFLILKGLTQLRLAANHPDLIEGIEGEQDSGKFSEVISKLKNVLEEGHKILIFSQFVRHLNLYRAHLEEKGYDFAYLTGATKNREEVINHFRHSPNCQVFLMSLKAGGVGLNLVEADYVFMLDPWWNPAAEFQAINRTHRIGQDKRVFAYKFITKNTIEEKILKLQEKKAQLARDIVQANQGLVNAMTEEDVDLLLS